MNIYISQGNESAGPFNRDEIQARIYSGELPRTTLARVEGGTEWMPLEALLSATTSPPPVIPAGAPVPTAEILHLLRDPKEKTALVWLYVASAPAWLLFGVWCVYGFGVPLLIVGIIELMHLLGKLWFAAHVKTNAVRVSETQLPEVYRIVQASCQKLNMECPDVYVLQENVWNSFATKVFGRRMVILLSGAVDSILLKGDMKQLSWLVGHELGHHWAGHLNIGQKMANVGGWFFWLALWHSRRAEFTCDRAGLYCAGSLKASQQALVNATVGAQLASRVNIAEAQNQWEQHRREFFVCYRAFYSTHPHLLARLAYLNGAAQELGIAA